MHFYRPAASCRAPDSVSRRQPKRNRPLIEHLIICTGLWSFLVSLENRRAIFDPYRFITDQHAGHTPLQDGFHHYGCYLVIHGCTSWLPGDRFLFLRGKVQKQCVSNPLFLHIPPSNVILVHLLCIYTQIKAHLAAFRQKHPFPFCPSLLRCSIPLPHFRPTPPYLSSGAYHPTSVLQPSSRRKSTMINTNVSPFIYAPICPHDAPDRPLENF